MKFLLIFLLFIGGPLIHGCSAGSLLYAVVASAWLLLAVWLGSRKHVGQPASFAHHLMLQFSVFPLYTHIRLVEGHFLVLRQWSGALSLARSGHQTPSRPSSHRLRLVFFGGPAGCGGGSEGERERTSGLSQNVRVFFPLILFHIMGLVL